MNIEVGSKLFPIWLLGDSNPSHWATDLETPLDPRHPARHSIWTPILDVIQNNVYRQARLRVDTSNIYIRNAIEDPSGKPKGNLIYWDEPVLEKLNDLSVIVGQFQPKCIFCFGAFAYEFARRAVGEKDLYSHNYWGAKHLGNDFRMRVLSFDPNRPNIFPLLHVTIARGKFIQSHDYFCDSVGMNYFDHVGDHIATLFLSYKGSLPIWIE